MSPEQNKDDSTSSHTRSSNQPTAQADQQQHTTSNNDGYEVWPVVMEVRQPGGSNDEEGSDWSSPSEGDDGVVGFVDIAHEFNENGDNASAAERPEREPYQLLVDGATPTPVVHADDAGGDALPTTLNGATTNGYHRFPTLTNGVGTEQSDTEVPGPNGSDDESDYDEFDIVLEAQRLAALGSMTIPEPTEEVVHEDNDAAQGDTVDAMVNEMASLPVAVGVQNAELREVRRQLAGGGGGEKFDLTKTNFHRHHVEEVRQVWESKPPTMVSVSGSSSTLTTDDEMKEASGECFERVGEQNTTSKAESHERVGVPMDDKVTIPASEEEIKWCMIGVKIPEGNVPDWAEKVSDKELVEKVKAKYDSDKKG